MWYPKHLTISIKLLSFITVLANASVASAADKPDDIEVLNIKPKSSETKFLRVQKELIKDSPLKLWGIAEFSAKDIVGDAIRFLTKSSWSHVGLILEDENNHSRYCFESTGTAGQVLKGIPPQVQISLWDEVVASYDGVVAQRQFIFTQEPPKSKAVVRYVKNNLGKPYEKDFTTLISAINAGNLKKKSLKERTSSVFCSEMLADFLQELECLNKDEASDNYLPHHFTSNKLPWINGVNLGELVMVKGDMEDIRIMKKSCCILL